MKIELAQPPRIKFLEALGTIADRRITLLNQNEALVKSSEGDRIYKVYLDTENEIADSDDNGTKYRNYIGYPIIAMLIKQGKLPYDEELAEALKGIKWRTINEKYKSYRKVEQVIKQQLKEKGIPPERIDNYIKQTQNQLTKYKLHKTNPESLNTP